MLVQFFKLSGAVLTLLLLNLTAADAASQCPAPRAGYPAIAFGMTGITKEYCKRQLDRARWLGFTSVTLNPTFYINQDGGVRPKNDPSELQSCLDHAYALGFDVVYKPMIEAEPLSNSANTSIANPKNMEEVFLQTLEGNPEAPWRAKFEFSPTDDYKKKAIEPFMTWLESKKKSDQAFKSFRASIVVATELHRSISEYPQAWNGLMWGLRSRLESEGLKYQIEVGIDPSVFGKELWLPSELKTSFTKESCAQYEAMLWTSDFFAPSTYGDYLAAGFKENPTQAIHKLFDLIPTNWVEAVRSRGCKLSPEIVARYRNADYAGRDKGRSSRRSWPGEIGYGGSLKRSFSQFETDPPIYRASDASYPEKLRNFEETTFKTDQETFVKTAPVWFKAVLDAARGSYWNTVSIWITARYDLFGFSDIPSLGDLKSLPGQYGASDPVRGPDVIPAVSELRDLLRSYTSERCSGWEPALPTKPVVRHRRKKPRPKTTDSITVTAPSSAPIEVEHQDMSGQVIEDSQ
jgi:hypothetical protein